MSDLQNSFFPPKNRQSLKTTWTWPYSPICSAGPDLRSIKSNGWAPTNIWCQLLPWRWIPEVDVNFYFLSDYTNHRHGFRLFLFHNINCLFANWVRYVNECFRISKGDRLMLYDGVETSNVKMSRNELHRYIGNKLKNLDGIITFTFIRKDDFNILESFNLHQLCRSWSRP